MLDVQAADFVTVALLVVLEGLLSADNALVMAIMVLGLPRRHQQKALRFGLDRLFHLGPTHQEHAAQLRCRQLISENASDLLQAQPEIPEHKDPVEAG